VERDGGGYVIYRTWKTPKEATGEEEGSRGGRNWGNWVGKERIMSSFAGHGTKICAEGRDLGSTKHH